MEGLAVSETCSDVPVSTGLVCGCNWAESKFEVCSCLVFALWCGILAVSGYIEVDCDSGIVLKDELHLVLVVRGEADWAEGYLFKTFVCLHVRDSSLWQMFDITYLSFSEINCIKIKILSNKTSK